MKASDLLKALLAATGLGPAATTQANLQQALRFGDEWADEVGDLFHDAHRAGEPARGEAALAELDEFRTALSVYGQIEAAVAAGPVTEELEQTVKQARKALREQFRNVSRALAGQPLWEPEG